MLHIYIPDIVQTEDYTITDPTRLHHLTVVCRVRLNDAVSLFDPQGNAYRGAISRITKNQLTVRIQSRLMAVPARFRLTVACALPKASAIDDVIDNLTQLGVDSIIPMLTERVVARPEEPAKKLERWQKIALSAAEQSQRNTLPEISPVLALDDVIRHTRGFELMLIPTLEGPTLPLFQALHGFNSGRIVVLIGPEGDFSPREVQSALQAGFKAVSLGPNVLKVTAAAAAISAVIKLTIPG